MKTISRRHWSSLLWAGALLGGLILLAGPALARTGAPLPAGQTGAVLTPPAAVKVCPALRLRTQSPRPILLAGRYRDASRANKANCEAWCNAHKPECQFCSTKRGCGSGYSRLNSWGGRGRNWHACGRRVSRRQASDRKMQECKEWCDANPACVKCLYLGPCQPGFRRLRTWRGRGSNIVACERRQYRDPASNRNREECEAWCRANKPECRKCSTLRNCGASLTNLRSWTGPGRNWHACRKKGTRREEGQRNRVACRQWCNANKPRCRMCSTVPTCGPSHRRLKSFTGPGRNWYACRWSAGVLYDDRSN